MNISLQGKVALVTGASSGIGRATALLLARAGAWVGCLDVKPEETAQVVETITGEGGRAIALSADISDAGALESAMEEFLGQTGQLDVVVANAGINGVWAPLEQITPEEWDRTIRVNLTGTFLTLRATVPHLKRRGGAAVIVSSVNGSRIFSNAGASAYSSSKAGQIALGRMLALELAASNVRVNTVCPGSIRTKIEQSTERRDLEEIRPRVIYPDGVVPLGEHQPGKAGQVAQLILFLVSDAASHISGTEVFIDGAESLLMG